MAFMIIVAIQNWKIAGYFIKMFQFYHCHEKYKDTMVEMH